MSSIAGVGVLCPYLTPWQISHLRTPRRGPMPPVCLRWVQGMQGGRARREARANDSRPSGLLVSLAHTRKPMPLLPSLACPTTHTGACEVGLLHVQVSAFAFCMDRQQARARTWIMLAH